MPGYEPFLLCDFHVHTQWSDGKLTVREVVDLYGQTGKFDVIAITDHILMKKDLLARAGQRALKEYVMLVVPGADAILRETRRQGALSIASGAAQQRRRRHHALPQQTSLRVTAR